MPEFIPNPQQQDVINHGEGPCLVAAVPGSGKTACVTERVKRLIKDGVQPYKILAITFTNKAAEEMKNRIGAAVGKDVASKMTICTFHSLCARILREFSSFAGLTKGFSVYDQDDQERLVRQSVREALLNPAKPSEDSFDFLSPPSPEEMAKTKAEEFTKDQNSTKLINECCKKVLCKVELERNGLMESVEADERVGMDKLGVDAAELYYKALRANNATDFTGLIYEVVTILEDYEVVRKDVSGRWSYVCVDEIQDTNLAQYELLKFLGMQHRNVMVVGDVDQSIYRFRGAEPENVVKFQRDFGATIRKLEKNYRSTPSILSASQRLIEHNSGRVETVLKTDNKDSISPLIRSHSSERSMAEAIAVSVIKDLDKGVLPSEVAVLFRTNTCSLCLEMAFKQLKIPYKLVGGYSFYDRKEVKVGLSLFSLISNPADAGAFENVAEKCCRGVGEKLLAKISQVRKSKKSTVIEAAKQVANGKYPALSELISGIEGVSKSSPGEEAFRLLGRLGFLEALRNEKKKGGQTGNDRVENLKELCMDVDGFVSRGNTLSAYLQNVSLMTSQDEPAGEKVRLMTMHSSKGLEFETVHISHATQTHLPHYRVISEAKKTGRPGELAQCEKEERRLLYVAMTRAKKKLVIHYPALVKSFGGKFSNVDPSPFLYETGLQMPDDDAKAPSCPRRHGSVAEEDAHERFDAIS